MIWERYHGRTRLVKGSWNRTWLSDLEVMLGYPIHHNSKGKSLLLWLRVSPISDGCRMWELVCQKIYLLDSFRSESLQFIERVQVGSSFSFVSWIWDQINRSFKYENSQCTFFFSGRDWVLIDPRLLTSSL